MTLYKVSAVNASGKMVNEVIDADSPKAARQKAREKNLTPVSVETTQAGFKPQRAGASDSAPTVMSGDSSGGSFKNLFVTISINDLANMTRQLASLVKAHVPIVESLSALIDQIEHPKLRPILSGVRQKVNEGSSIGDGFAAYPDVFNRVYVNMVKAGESSGRLDVVLLRLADLIEGQVKLKNKVTMAMAYPIIISIIGFLVLGIIFVKVVPKITQIFIDLKHALPLPTRILISISDFAQNYVIHVLVGVLAIALFFERFVKTEKGRYWLHFQMLRLPIIHGIFRGLAVSRFARSLGTLLASGVPMLAALDISKNVVNNALFEQALEGIQESVSQGKQLASSLKQAGGFPPIVIHMVGVGEKTGELEPMLLSVAENFEQEVETKLGTLTSLLEPIMMVIMALLVGFIVISVLLPIFEMNQFGV